MSNILIKDMVVGITTIPDIPAIPPYCIDRFVRVWLSFQTLHDRFGEPLPPLPPGAEYGYSENIGGRDLTPTGGWYGTHGTYRSILYHSCSPGVPGVPGRPGRAPNFFIGWNAGAASIGGLVGDGQYSFHIAPSVVGVVTGLNDNDASVDAGYLDINYGLYFTNGTVVVCELGSQRTVAVPYEFTDTFYVLRTGTEVRYYQNHTLLYTSTIPSLGPVRADASMYFGGDRVFDAALSTSFSIPVAGSSGSYAGDLGEFVVFGSQDEAGIAALDLGEFVVDAQVVYDGSYAGDLGALLVGAYDANTVFASLDLGDIVVDAQANLFAPDYAAVAADLGDISMFAVALNNELPAEAALDLGEFNLYAADSNVGIAALDLGELDVFAFGLDTASFSIGYVELPLFRTSMYIYAGGNATATFELPLLEVEGYTGGVAEVELPMLEVSGDATIPVLLNGDIELPALEVSGTGIAGAVMSGALTLPLLQTTSDPEFSSYSNWGLPGQHGLYLPMLQVAGHAYRTEIISGVITLPGLDVIATAVAGLAPNIGYILLPALDSQYGLSGSLYLPGLRVAGRVARPVVEARTTWVMNLSNNAVTQFDNFAFNSMAFAHGYYWGAGMDGGLWRMGGDLDDAEPIAWEWLSGLADFGMPSKKGLMALYLDGVIGSGVLITVLSDDATRVYDHVAAGDDTNHQPQRVSLGRGIRTRNIGVGMASTLGAYLELDSVTPEYIVTKRNL